MCDIYFVSKLHLELIFASLLLFNQVKNALHAKKAHFILSRGHIVEVCKYILFICKLKVYEAYKNGTKCSETQVTLHIVVIVIVMQWTIYFIHRAIYYFVMQIRNIKIIRGKSATVFSKTGK